MEPHRTPISRTGTLALAVTLTLAMLVPPAGAAIAVADTAEASHVIVAWGDGADSARVVREIGARGLGMSRRLYGGDAVLVSVPRGRDAGELARALAGVPGVAYAEPDTPVEAQFAPDDTLYVEGRQWAPSRIQAEAAWDVATGAGTVVAIVDTGVDLDHEDLQANLWTNDGEVPGNGIDDDGNGLADDVAGWDFVNADALPDDDNGHGSHCAGIVAAVTNNALGIAGIAHGARIMPVKVLDSGGRGSSAALAEGIDYAVASGADVVSVSIGGSLPNATLSASVARARAEGVLVVAAAGNEGGAVLYPAADPGTMCVGATDDADVRASYSNYGAEMDVVAPGGTSEVPVLSTIRNGVYGLKYGTSMATPHASAVAALLLEMRPHLSPDGIQFLLGSTAADGGVVGWDPYYGHGLIQARDALDLMLGDVTAPTSICSTASAPPEGVEVVVKPDDVGLGVDRVDWWLDNGTSGTGERIEVTAPGSRTLSYVAVDLAGNRDETRSVSFEVTDTLAPVTTSDAAAVYYGGSATVTLSAADRGAGVAATRWSLDGSVPTIGTVIETIDTGDHLLAFGSTDLLGHVEPTQTVAFRLYGNADVTRLSGETRYETAIAISRETFAAGSATGVVVASGENFPDALAAAGLAGALDGPVLLTRKDSLPAGVLVEIERLGVTRIVVVGGEAAVSPAVVAALQGTGIAVERVGGTDRYGTAVQVAGAMRQETGASPETAFVVRGDSFADALAVAPIAYRRGYPVLLTRSDSLAAATGSALDALGVGGVLIAGGEAAVSEAVADAIGKIIGTPPTRVGGQTRYATAALVAQHALDQGWVAGPHIGIATGADYPDALCGGAAAGARDGVVALTVPDALSAEARALVETRSRAGAPVHVYGGASAVGSVVVTRLRQIPLL